MKTSLLIFPVTGVVKTSVTLQSFRFIESLEVLNISIHSGSPPEGVNIISFITIVPKG